MKSKSGDSIRRPKYIHQSASAWPLSLLVLLAGISQSGAQTVANGVNEFNSASTDYLYISPGPVDTLTENRAAKVAFFNTAGPQIINLGDSGANVLTLAGIDNQGGLLTIQRGGASNGSLAIGPTNALSVSGSSDLLISAVISGAGGALTSTSLGTLILAGVNTYNGGTNVNAGTVQIGNGVTGSLANAGGVSVADGATLAFNLPNSTYGGAIANAGTIVGLAGNGLTNTLSGILSGTGGFTQTGVGTTVLGNAGSSFTGNVLINAGTVRVTGGLLGVNPATSALGNSQIAGRTVTVSAGASLRFEESDILGNADSIPLIALKIAGTAVSKGKLTTLGPVELAGGRLTADGGLNFGGSAIGSINLNGVVSVTGTTPSFMDATTAANSRFLLNNTGARITAFDVADVSADAANDLTLSALLANPWDFGADNVPAGLTKSGAGTMALGNVGNSFTGNVAVLGGTLAVTAGFDSPTPVTSALGHPRLANRTITVASGATLRFQASDSLGNAFSTPLARVVAEGGTIVSKSSLTTFGVMTLNGGTLTADGGLNFGGFDIGSVVMNGTITVGGSVPSLMNDTGAANSRFLLSSVGTHATTFNVANVTNDSAPDLTISTTIANPWGGQPGNWAGALNKVGTGTLVLAAANLYTGATTVQEGTLQLDGTITGSDAIVQPGGALGGQGVVNSLVCAGLLAPSDPQTPGTGLGSVSSVSDILLSGTTQMDISKSGFVLSDFVISGTQIVYGGALTISASGEPLADGDVFNLFDAPMLSNGAFASVALPALEGSLAWDLSKLNLDGTIAVIPEPDCAVLLLASLGILARRRRLESRK